MQGETNETHISHWHSPETGCILYPMTQTQDQISRKARYIMIGGFLGAGKTTTVAQLAKTLSDQGMRVGLITNDQGTGLVDTAMLRSRGFATAEIPGGCFCCRFNSLVDAAQSLTSESAPEVFIAEPVGSCTDLVATVTYPLRRIYGDQFEIAPLSVMVDPVRAMRVFGLVEGRQFSEKVVYIYKKQLEEADIIVINKIDSISKMEREQLTTKLQETFPGKTITSVSAREGEGLSEWFEQLKTTSQKGGKAMEVDYEIYAEGEALLGWLNATVNLKADQSFDGNAWIKELAINLQQSLGKADAEIAHLKMTLSPDEGLGDIAVINLVRNDFLPELSQNLPDDCKSGQLIINLRAEAAPELLNHSIMEALAKAAEQENGITATLDHVEHFRPGKPEPTHRLTELVTA